jgi:phosphate transport system substrate-binding protein
MRQNLSEITFSVALVLAITFTLSCTSNGGDDPSGSSSSVNKSSSSSGNEESFTFTMENYPRVDGSTSTNPLNSIIAAKLLDLEYEWRPVPELNQGSSDVFFKDTMLAPDFRQKIQCSQTHGAIINLIDNKTDLIIVARTMSKDEKQHADSIGVSLIETPIALDGLDFIINSRNPVNSLLVEQIRNIYLGNITNWNEVGGANFEIKPFIRNANSGSQEMMNEIVMKNTGMPDWDSWLSEEDVRIGGMIHVYYALTWNPDQGICFTPHYYKEYMIGDFASEMMIKTLAINGIAADKSTIKNKSYPFVANVYVSIRSDLDKNSSAYKLYQWLQTSSGKLVIEESGYVPN